jgi:hypothetical protein
VRTKQDELMLLLQWYCWKFRFGRNARFLYLQKSGGPRSGADLGFQQFGNPANPGNFCAAAIMTHS